MSLIPTTPSTPTTEESSFRRIEPDENFPKMFRVGATEYLLSKHGHLVFANGVSTDIIAAEDPLPRTLPGVVRVAAAKRRAEKGFSS